MTREEMIIKKGELDSKILNLINEFEEYTGLTVCYINLDNYKVWDNNTTYKTCSVNSEVKLIN